MFGDIIQSKMKIIKRNYY